VTGRKLDVARYRRAELRWTSANAVRRDGENDV
jgi:hypothetical protein